MLPRDPFSMKAISLPVSRVDSVVCRDLGGERERIRNRIVEGPRPTERSLRRERGCSQHRVHTCQAAVTIFLIYGLDCGADSAADTLSRTEKARCDHCAPHGRSGSGQTIQHSRGGCELSLFDQQFKALRILLGRAGNVTPRRVYPG